MQSLIQCGLVQERGIAEPSYVASLINAHGGTPSDKERDAIAWTAVSFFTGGVDTVRPTTYLASLIPVGIDMLWFC